MVSPNLSEIITTTLRNNQKRLADNVTESNALLNRLNKQGKMRTLSGGYEIKRELSYAENGTAQWYSGYDVLDITPSDVLTSATYAWKQIIANVSISGEEERQNAGSDRLINLLESRINNAENTLKNAVNRGMYSDGTDSGGKIFNGLRQLVADDPTTGVVGGINRATYEFWRNYVLDASDEGAVVSATNIVGYMNKAWNNLVRGQDKPDMIMADVNFFEFYQDALQDQKRFTSDDMANAAFVSLKYNTADVVLENSENSIPSDHMYFLNTKYLGFDVHQSGNFTPQPAKTSVNQDAMVFPILLMGNLTMDNAQLQGVIKN